MDIDITPKLKQAETATRSVQRFDVELNGVRIGSIEKLTGAHQPWIATVRHNRKWYQNFYGKDGKQNAINAVVREGTK